MCVKWICVLCLMCVLCAGVCESANLADQMAETTQRCCEKGTAYARSMIEGPRSPLACSSMPVDLPADIPSLTRKLCSIAMAQCCSDYNAKLIDCDQGIELARSKNSCDSIKDTAKVCCRECLRGETDAASKGAAACANTTSGEIVSLGAYSLCCKKAVQQKNKSEVMSVYKAIQGSTKRNEKIQMSLCEEYAPNELCAHHCIPVPGSYRCECNPGFKLMADGRNCVEVQKNRCKPRNPCQHKCNDNGVSVKCSCRRGYRLLDDGVSCEDINECVTDPHICLIGTECHNIQGSYKCIPVKRKPVTQTDMGPCPAGYMKNVANKACDDINECKLPNPPCPPSSCRNTMGGYQCDGVPGDPANLPARTLVADDRCPPGFKTGAAEECDDVDECAIDKHDCNLKSQFCINVRGSFYCQEKGSKHCPPGFKINQVTQKCEDINECEDGQDICRSDQICVNTLGEFDCKPKYTTGDEIKCPEGMRLNEKQRICEDIDECAEGTHLCDQYQNCLNTKGSHECHCKLGFELDPFTGACTDINECATEQHNCIPESQRCDNTVGSFLCIRFTSCGTGYILHHSKSKCEDIDECALGIHNCARAGPDYTCMNIPGSFRCMRKPSSTTSTTAAPDYEYEYYDSDEIIDNTTMPKASEVPQLPQPTERTTSTTTRKPVTTPPPTTPPATTAPTTTPSTTTPSTTTPSTTMPSTTTPSTTTPSTTTPSSTTPSTTTSATKPTTAPPPTTTPKPSWRRPPQNKNTPSDSESDLFINTKKERPNIDLKIPVTTKETEDHAVPPYLVDIKPGAETAIIKGEKTDDGSIVVNTKDIPKNKWTRIDQKPSSDCSPGFEVDFYGACVDTDECAKQTHQCSGLTEVCRNTMGGYVCDCKVGFRREMFSGVCALVASSTTSTSTAPSTPKRINNLFFGYPDIPTSKLSSFKPTSSCDVGFYFNAEKAACDDVNECRSGEARCAAEEVCVNTYGGYRCECPPGWHLDEKRHRCLSPNDKHAYENIPEYAPDPAENDRSSSQVAHYGGADVKHVDDTVKITKCPWGYKEGDDGKCEDINECLNGEARCGAQQLCTNLPGGYTCSCPRGHRLAGEHLCEDIDECQATGGVPICSQNAYCINTVGSYMCRCHDGFRSAPINDKVCVDVDECTEQNGNQLCQHRCNNIWGSYRCSCHRGYRLNEDNRTCSDVDECTEFKSKLLCVGRCVNEPGSYRCSCPSGYRLSEDSRSCIDIDECETGEAPCASGTSFGGVSDVCLNTRGAYRCIRIACPAGYALEGKHRCTKVERVCPPGDWSCAHQPTTYSYNFITFVSNLYIPSAKVDLFTMRGPSWPNALMKFTLTLGNVDAPPSVRDRADIGAFLLVQHNNQAVLSLIRSLEGPQSIELELAMELYSGEQFGGTAVAKIFIYVSEYEF